MKIHFLGPLMAVAGLCAACGDETGGSTSAGGSAASTQSTTGSGGQGTGAQGGASAGGMAGAGGGGAGCGDMNLTCGRDQICVKNVLTMGPTERVTWSCADDPCAPEPLSCDCAMQICADGPTGCSVDAVSGELVCTSGGVCAAPDTPIATPRGERPIAELAVGDLVFSMHQGKLQAVPLVQIRRRPVTNHAVVEVALASGGTLHISAPHPTADGRTFRDLAPNDMLGDERVVGVATVPYAPSHTYDILPASDSGTYVAGGALVGSTLRSR